ncbi:hypothetical protein M407DRAFT_19865 [Tulasnella calospora MUT 4182]|uniref:DUF6593 domain-containing protein n=1 Tax=Tulasnella calospora MUT 4182 TaxID=1051891 RepID=A0A0C3LBL7_9AGAM|nr:hypothetical protein M407DRAFT_19865 [Tulasnella calospora MUT 4182]
MDGPSRTSGSSAAPTADDMVRLNWTRNSVYNTIISSEDNEIMYEVSTPNIFSLTKRLTTITRMDKSSGQKVFAGEIAWKATQNRAQVRVGWQNCEWTLAQEWLKNPKGISTAKTFTAAQGAQYRWKLRNLKYHLTCPEDPEEGRNPSLAIFNCPFLKGLSPAYLEVSSSALHNLDYILVSLLVMEKNRRD